MHTEHLIFAFAMVTTGPDYETEQIVEMAAVVLLPPSLRDETFENKLKFHTLVCPTKKLPSEVIKQTGIRPEDIEKEPGFSEAFKRFLDWIQSVVREGRRLSSDYLITGLVSHYGYWTDFRYLLTEISRHFSTNIEDVIGLWCQFGDSWELFTRLKKIGHVDAALKSNFDDLYEKFCGEKLIASRAIDKAEALARLLSIPVLQKHLGLMDFLTFSAFKTWFEKEKPNRMYLEDLIDHFGLDSISMDLMQLLSYKKISFQKLSDVFCRSRSDVQFRMKMKTLHDINLSTDESKEIYRACATNRTCCCACIPIFSDKRGPTIGKKTHTN